MATPKLRFKEFDGDWSKKRLDSFLERISNPVNVVDTQNYVQIGIRSHGKGIFHKESVTGKEIGNKRVFWVVPNALIVNIVFAWERAIAVTSDKENGLIASHRFPMYLPKDGLSDVNFLRYLFITDKGQSYLELASPGGAGRNKTLGQSNFAELKIDLPTVEEQTKIAFFLSIVDEKISQLTQKHELLSQYKQGMMQKLFSQQIRFKADDGSEFGEWATIQVKDIFEVTRGQVLAVANTNVFSTQDYQYPVFSSQTKNNGLMGFYTEYLFEDAITWTTDGANAGEVNFRKGKFYCTNVCGVLKNKEGYANVCVAEILNSVTRKYVSYVGNPKLMNNVMAEIPIQIPSDIMEQTKIANFLSAIDQKIEKVAQQIEETKQWKKGLLQQLFV